MSPAFNTAPKCSREGGRDMPLMEADSPCIKWTSGCFLLTHNSAGIFQRKCPGRVGEEKNEVIRDADMTDFFSCVDLVEIVAFCRSKRWRITSFSIQAYFKIFQLITHWLFLASALLPTLSIVMLKRSGIPDQGTTDMISFNSSAQCWSKKKKSGREGPLRCHVTVQVLGPSTGPLSRLGGVQLVSCVTCVYGWFSCDLLGHSAVNTSPPSCSSSKQFFKCLLDTAFTLS